jgi:imidazolonepropionase
VQRGAAVAAAMATGTGPLPARGPGSLSLVSPGAIAWEGGRIVFAGSPEDLPWAPDVGASDHGLLVPGFVDCHVHLPFIGWRADEFEARVAGASYRDLHGQEGGIFRSSRLLHEASDDQVIEFCRPLLEEMLSTGTTATELKTGYGLSVEEELRQARLARRLADDVAGQTCTVTLLACHAVPPGMDRASWVRAACDELIPATAADGLADQVDVYVEDIAFTLRDLELVAAAAAGAGLALRVHADQLGPGGTAEAASALGARSADHLNHCSEAGVAALARAGTVAVLLPAASFFLRSAPPPVDALRRGGAPISIATDLNPGTSPVTSIPETIAIAAAAYGLPPGEALVAVTANAAWVLGLDTELGTLERGKRADFLLLEEPSFANVAYRPGHNPVAATFLAGELAAGSP